LIDEDLSSGGYAPPPEQKGYNAIRKEYT